MTYDQVFDFDRAAGDRLVFYTAAPGASAASVLAGMAQVNIGADTALLVETLTGSFRIDLYGSGPITAADIVVVAAAFPADWL